jgi:hypothetical protein
MVFLDCEFAGKRGNDSFVHCSQHSFSQSVVQSFDIGMVSISSGKNGIMPRRIQVDRLGGIRCCPCREFPTVDTRKHAS